ncbi:sigma-54-dependent transcriptional regulator [Syntrophotalea carbinolica DSM 2380]|uniref:Sigma-54-dependent transcriptional regulator n=1 Tax=Syntrophotalea carbinolica (strain DSM 2380 / NBRC 103641 / GraBd1) TaxID=338963 RepID=Q3A7M8_SYNC1|nr:sigma-54 dependent transcriptional regulator [Syntrophotalea carbinolica]ABA87616.1 sigma-54-dependent transcriptional regulator [Syntrophotalea carbinolica DSM 2380]
MEEQSMEQSHGALPVPAPDLVIAEGPGGHWRVKSLSGSLARLLGLDVSLAVGRFADQLLPGSVPSLEDLARDAVSAGRALLGIRVRLGAQPDLWSIDVRPLGLDEAFRAHEVAIVFRQLEVSGKEAPVSLYGMVGNSPAIREVFRKIALFAPSDAAVVITGETGTGKELVARALHDQSLRPEGPFVAVNCSAISDELLESELFGHEKGAFTGALRSHRGRFERADGGTLFLDEAGDMPLNTQAKLLRVLEEGMIERVGAERQQRVDVRIVAATNVPLEQAVGMGRFRADLYHRISVLRIHLPPLRERAEDIPHLVEHFLKLFARKYGRRVYRLTPEAVNLLRSYLWPGNIRELRNVLERVFIENRADVIGARAFGEWIRERQDFLVESRGQTVSERDFVPAMVLPHREVRDEAAGSGPDPTVLEAEFYAGEERRRSTRPVNLTVEEVARAYCDAGGNLADAARRLGVHRATLYRYMKKLGLSRATLERQCER